jgi:hypothetical protein
MRDVNGGRRRAGGVVAVADRRVRRSHGKATLARIDPLDTRKSRLL